MKIRKYLLAAYLGFATAILCSLCVFAFESYHLQLEYFPTCLSSLMEYFGGEPNTTIVEGICTGLLGSSIALLIQYIHILIKDHKAAYQAVIGIFIRLLPAVPFFYVVIRYVKVFW